MDYSPDDRFDLLYRTSQTFNSSLDLHIVLNTVIDEVISITGAERGFVMLGNETAELTFAVARGMDQQAIESPEFEVSRSIISTVAETAEPVLSSNVDDDDWGKIASVKRIGLRSVMCAPILLKEEIIGVIYVDSRIRLSSFTPRDLELLNAIASTAAIAIENARLYELAVEKGRMERELQVAFDVQASFMPDYTPELPGWEFAAYWEPARMVSGDFYDFIDFDGHEAGVIIADVSDKGMPAALFMALARSTLRGSIFATRDPALAVARTNLLLCEDSNGMFVSLFYARVSARGNVLFVNGGHNPPLLYSGGTFDLLERTGVILGIFEDITFTNAECTLQPGDFLFMYTDGVNEAVSPEREEFGLHRVMETLSSVADQPAEAMLDALKQKLADFTDSAPLFDDITMVLIKRL